MLAGCGETYARVNQHQVVVYDRSGIWDGANAIHACQRIGQVFVNVEPRFPQTDDGDGALVTCRASQ